MSDRSWYVVNGNADGRRSEVASRAACLLATCGKIQPLNPHLPCSPSSSPQTHPLQPMKCLRMRVNPRLKETRSRGPGKSSRLEVCKVVTVRNRVLCTVLLCFQQELTMLVFLFIAGGWSQLVVLSAHSVGLCVFCAKFC